MEYSKSEVLKMLNTHTKALRNTVPSPNNETLLAWSKEDAVNDFKMSIYDAEDEEDDIFPFFNVSSSVKIKK